MTTPLIQTFKLLSAFYNITKLYVDSLYNLKGPSYT